MKNLIIIIAISKTGRLSGHANLNLLFKQTLASICVPSVLEPAHLYRTGHEKHDGMTPALWKQSKHLLWDITVVDSLAPSRLYAGWVGNPGIATAEAF